MKAVVIFSGGQDSTTCLGWAKNRYEEVVALSFFYGQKHAVELYQGEIIAEKLGVERHVIQADFFGSMVDSALTHNGNVNVPHGRLAHLPASYVPNRNAFFLTLAHAFAQKIGAGVLVAGMCQTDFSGYADCRAVFMKYMQSSLNLGVYGHDLTPDWVAGLIEGEGSFSRGSYPTKDEKKFYPTFTIEQADLGILEQLQSFFGCGTICKRSKASNPLGKKDTWEFKLPQSKCKYVYNLLMKYTPVTSRLSKVQSWMEEFERFFIDGNDGSFSDNMVNATSGIKIETPLMYLTKAETFTLAEAEGILPLVLEDSHTCYNGDRSKRHAWGYGCGECPACQVRAKGWAEYKA